MNAAVKKFQNLVRKARRDQLVLEHLDLVRHVLGRMALDLPLGADVENLEAAGALGLVEAAGNYDEGRGVPFRPYAHARVRGAILDELRRNCPLPQHMLQRWALIREAYSRLDSPVRLDDLTRMTGLSELEVRECLLAMRLAHPDSGDFDQMAAETADRRLSRPDQLMTEQDHARLLAEAIERLPERHRLVLTMYYTEDLRLREIGEVLGLSEGRVCRILQEAEGRAREFVRGRTGREAA